MTTHATNPTPAIDNVTALSLLVTAFNNPKVADTPLSEAIQLKAVEAFKELCALKGVQPTKEALAVYLRAAWGSVSDGYKLAWMQMLIKACER